MEKLIRLVVVIFLIMAGIKYGKPFLEHAMRGGSGSTAERPSGDDPGAECVYAARQARDAFGSTMSSLKPGSTDFDMTSSLDDAIYEARSVCNCATAACDYASRALDLLADTSSQVADPQQIGRAALEAARRLEQVDDLLDRAAAQ